MNDFCTLLRESLLPDGEEAARRQLSGIRPLALAYLGDTILDLYIRSHLVLTTQLKTNQMHKKATSLVNANAQSAMMKLIMDELSEEELKVFKAARNQKPSSLPKNMSVVDYKWATGMEALLGYLFVSGQDERLMQLLNQAVTAYEKNSN